MNFQKYSDKFLEKTFLPFFPRWMTPNQVSYLRIASMPFIFYFLLKEAYITGFIIFIIAALTDAVDGAMARTRNQITETGKVLDAVADRGLIFLVAIIFIPRIFGWTILVLMAILEGFNALMARRSSKIIGMHPRATWAGKVKMIVQCFAFGMIFVGIFHSPVFWIPGAHFLLWVSIALAFFQGFTYPKVREKALNK